MCTTCDTQCGVGGASAERAAEAQHRHRQRVARQIEQLGVDLGLLEDVADVARPDAERLGGHDRVLRRDECVGARHHEVAEPGRVAVLDARQ